MRIDWVVAGWEIDIRFVFTWRVGASFRFRGGPSMPQSHYVPGKCLSFTSAALHITFFISQSLLLELIYPAQYRRTLGAR